MRVEIRKNTLIRFVILLALIGLTVIGYFVSPHDSQGRPVLLLPEVRAIEQYRRHASGWVDGWKNLDGDLHAVLEAEDNNLLALSHQVQSSFDEAIALAKNVDATESPSPLLGLHDLSMQTAVAYVDASIATARWLSAPSKKNRMDADQALLAAGEELSALHSNEWIVGQRSR